VGLRAVVLDVGDDFKPDDLVREALRTRLASADAMNAQLDIDLGSVVPDDFEGRVPLSDDWAAYAQSQIDGELLERLHDQWLRAKGAVSAPKTDWEPRDPGDLVGWNEAHPTDRADLYLDGDNVFIAEELYCVRPGCGCNEAVVAFAPTTRGSSDIGAIRVQIRTLELVERNAKPDKTLLLDRLWKAFTARHRHLAERLARRAGSGNSDLTDSGNSDHPGASSDRRGPSIAVANRRGKAKDDRHGQKARDPGPASSRTQPGRDGQARRRVAKQRPAHRD
jgi:hypothetical protein